MFTKYGTMTKCGIQYDEMGYSTKIAKIEFSTTESAKEAKDELDGNYF